MRLRDRLAHPLHGWFSEISRGMQILTSPYRRSSPTNVKLCTNAELSLEAIEYLLLSGQAFVIFDGLDELVDATRRREVAERVELFSSRYPLATILVTSRRVGYEQAGLDPLVFSQFGLGGFDDEDVDSYVRKWLLRWRVLTETNSLWRRAASRKRARRFPTARRPR